jgi:hypothetical protein
VRTDTDLFIGWAAEEFVRAGRADCQAARWRHRRQAELLADICIALQASAAPRRRGTHHEPIGAALDRAFGLPK